MGIYVPGFPITGGASAANTIPAFTFDGSAMVSSFIPLDQGYIVNPGAAGMVHRFETSGPVSWPTVDTGQVDFLLEGNLDIDIAGTLSNPNSGPTTMTRVVTWTQDAIGGWAMTFSNGAGVIVWAGGVPAWSILPGARNAAIFHTALIDGLSFFPVWIGQGFVNIA